jgi:hypothetical protein
MKYTHDTTLSAEFPCIILPIRVLEAVMLKAIHVDPLSLSTKLTVILDIYANECVNSKHSLYNKHTAVSMYESFGA